MKSFVRKFSLLGIAVLMLASACSLPSFNPPTPFPTTDFDATTTAIATQLERSLPTPTALPTQEAAATPLPSAIPSLPAQAPSAFPTVTSPALTHLTMIDVNYGWGLTSQYILRTHDGGAS